MRRDKDLQWADRGKESHLVDVANETVNDLTLEGLHDNGRVDALEASLASAGHNLALADVVDHDDRDDVAGVVSYKVDQDQDSPIFAGTCPLDILVQFLFQVVLELGAKVGRVKEDGVCELSLLT
jgi:hypothetical protein